MMTVGKEAQTESLEKTSEDIFEYRKLIIEMIEKIDNQAFLHFTYNLLNSFKKKWGI